MKPDATDDTQANAAGTLNGAANQAQSATDTTDVIDNVVPAGVEACPVDIYVPSDEQAQAVKARLDTTSYALILKQQKGEATEYEVYKNLAKREKHAEHKRTLSQISADEKNHEMVWRAYTNTDVRPKRLQVIWFSLLAFVLGYTFVIRLMESGESKAQSVYARLKDTVPEISQIIADERRHEDCLIDMLDEERLHHMGDIVLGLNDALVELTGAIAGFTLALANTRLIALSGIITGISATLSMAASNYLASRTEGNPNALKASVYTGVAYLITVVILILPYLLFGEDQYIAALITMLICAVVIIFAFNFYESVAEEKSFWPHFLSMTAISLGVAVISFGIGVLAKMILGVDV
ncbi:MAG: VIT1/CCC1 transporter family protein [Coriobacteriales bacterium]|jgi:VIT1/CCC1 family predicted Fe2+/Mn2+ transporter|nr:VIT1/CCC1 transporter family protein [Coriobacteriales bacterium]